MKQIFVICVLMLAVERATAVETPELDRLRANYQASVERATKPLMQAYLIELQRQHDDYVRAGKPDAANVVAAEISAIRQALSPASVATKPVAPTVQGTPVPKAVELQWFVGKSWLTDAKTKWTFARNGTGEKVRGREKIATFTWTLQPSGNVQLIEQAAPGKPTTTMYLQFKGRSEAWFGLSEDKLENRLHTE